MKNSAHLFVTLSLFAFACGHTNPSMLKTSFYQDASLSNDYPFIIGGDSIVFERYYQREDDEMIADDEYSEDLYIQTPNVNSFEYTSEDLKKLNIQLKPHCFCIPTIGTSVVDGSLSGSKKSGKWKLKGLWKCSSFISGIRTAHISLMKLSGKI